MKFKSSCGLPDSTRAVARLLISGLLVGVYASSAVAESASGGQSSSQSSSQPVDDPDSGAVHWYIESAKQGYASSQYQLGQMYATGEVVAQDHAQSMHWFQLAALQDYPPAQFSLAQQYQRGAGVEIDYVTAYAWYHVAAMNRVAAAGDARDYLQQLMDAEQVSLAHWQVKKLWKKIAAAQLASPAQ